MSTYPERFEFIPKKQTELPKLTIREAGTTDFYQLHSLIQPTISKSRLNRYLTSSLYSVYVAVRNHRYPGAVIISEHDPFTFNTEILHLQVHEHYRRQDVASRLLYFSALEQPEHTLSVMIEKENYELMGFFHHMGFKKCKNEDTDFRDSEVDQGQDRWCAEPRAPRDRAAAGQ